MNTILCNFFWTDVFPDLWWGLVVAVVIIWSQYIVRPLIKGYINSKIVILDKQQSHEKQMKDDAHEREKEWVHFNDIKACTDKQMQEKQQQLKKENKDLKNQLELEKVNQDLLDKQLKVYKAFMSALNLEIKPKAENSKKE